jgi:prolyl-tRNA synthetase
MDLIGIPCRIVLSERSLGAQQVEFKRRRDAQPSTAPLAGLVPFVREQLASA